MKSHKVWLALLVVVICIVLGQQQTSAAASSSTKKRVCYLLSGTRYKQHLIRPELLKLSLCTHVIHGFVAVQETAATGPRVLVDNTMDIYMKAVNRLRNANNETKSISFLASIGSDQFSFVRHNLTATNIFLDSLVALIEHYQLDGIDIDWEFPYLTDDKITFTNLIRAIRTRFDKESAKLRPGRPPLLLTTALSPVIYIAYKSYQMRELAALVDFVNLMTYDYHSPNTLPLTNHNAPLHATHLDRFYFKYFNVAFSAKYVRRLGMPADKIVVGIPFYGYLYFLDNEQRHDLYALSNGTQAPIVYNEICQRLKTPDTTRVFDAVAKVPYLYRHLEWISYDDLESVAIKCQWVVDQKLGGVMSFALNYDDFGGHCPGNLTYPLQSIIFDIVGGQ